MPRQRPASERLPSQRASAEERRAEAEAADERRGIEWYAAELAQAQNLRNSAERKVKELEHELEDYRPLGALNNSIKEISNHQSSNWYEHVKAGAKWFARFHPNDRAPLLAAVAGKLTRDAKEEPRNYMMEVIMGPGVKAAREELLSKHEAEIAAHLEENVFSGELFSVLRLVAKISSRVCGLINQSSKWVHNSDGTKTRQMLHPRKGCSTPATGIFDLKRIIASETEALRRSKLLLQQHPDRKGADICGKAFALDRAFYDSICNSSRAGGMATAGTVANGPAPHVRDG